MDFSQVRSCDKTLVKERLTCCCVSCSEMWQVNWRVDFSRFPGSRLLNYFLSWTSLSVWMENTCLKFEKQYFCIPRVWYGEGNGTHPSTLAWKIPWTEEPGGLQSTGSRRVGHDWATSLSLFTFMHWRRKWQPTPIFLPRESQGREPGGLPPITELDTTDVI